MQKFLVGSRLLGLNKSESDYDYVLLLESADEKVDMAGEADIRLCGTLEQLQGFFELDSSLNLLKLRGMYQLDRDIIGDIFPYEYHFYEHRQAAKKLLQELLTFNNNRGDHCIKQVYHIQYMLFMLQNNSGKLTNEQLEIIRKIYNRQMPAEYLVELQEAVEQL